MALAKTLDTSIHSSASTHLDALRSIAAIAVLLSHLRNLFFQDYPALVSPGPLLKAFYFLTGFGHQAVMIFFVLSGAMVSLGVYKDRAKGRWSWPSYLIQRCTRIFIVLWPALLMTFLWDWSGRQLFGSAHIYGGDELGGNIIPIDIAAKSTLYTYLANAVLLNTIHAYSAGTNGALWSLPNEFWYYLLFPALVGVVAARNWKQRTLSLCFATATGLWLPSYIRSYFLIWLMGALVSWFWAALPRPQRGRTPAVLLSFTLLLGALALTRIPSGEAFAMQLLGFGISSDYLLGIATAFIVYFLNVGPSINETPQPSLYRSTARGVAEFSYSIYLTHLPFLVFLRAAFIREARWQPDALHLGLGALLLAVAMGYAYLFARATEFHTAKIRAKLAKRFLPRAPAVVLVHSKPLAKVG